MKLHNSHRYVSTRGTWSPVHISKCGNNSAYLPYNKKSIASGERSLSVLKRVKNYIRNSMNQDRLGSWALLCIESAETKKANFDQQIDNFAKLKCRKKVLSSYYVMTSWTSWWLNRLEENIKFWNLYLHVLQLYLFSSNCKYDLHYAICN